jgi:pectin methylesterase-like acyl-CoA thioesterase
MRRGSFIVKKDENFDNCFIENLTVNNLKVNNTSNNLIAEGLYSANNTNIVSTFTSPNPTPGQVLTAISSTSAHWTTLSNVNPTNTYYVRKNPGANEYLTIASALAAVNTGVLTYNSRAVIFVYPGYYQESVQLVLPQYVSIVGIDMNSVRIEPLAVSSDFIQMNTNTGLAFLTIQNVPSAYNAITFNNVGDYSIMHKVEIENCPKCIYASCTSIDTLIYLEYVSTSFGATDYCLTIQDLSGGSNSINVSIENFFTFGDTNTVFNIIGSGAKMFGSGVTVQDGTGDPSSIAVQVQNGASAEIIGMFVDSYGTVINIPNDAGTPSAILQGITMNSCVKELQIDNVNTNGYFSGYTDYSKTFINKSSNFFITNQDSRVITVAKLGGNYSTVYDALQSITDASSINRYIIFVGPGIFNETNVLDFTPIGKRGITLTGYFKTNTTLRYTGVGQSFIVAGGNLSIKQLTISLEPSTPDFQNIIQYNGSAVSSELLRLNNVILTNPTATRLNALVNISDASGPSTIVMEDIEFNGVSSFRYGVNIFNTTNNPISYIINGILWNRNISPVCDSVINVNAGAISRINGSINGGLIRSNVLSIGGVGITINNLTTTYITNLLLSGFTTGLNLPNSASVRQLAITATTFNNNTNDFIADGSITTLIGTVNITGSRTKVNITGTTALGLTISDINGSIVASGDIYQGTTLSTVTNITQQLQKAATVGSITEVIVNPTGGLNLQVPAGSGYVMSSINPASNYLVYIEWITTNLIMNDNATNYIYIDNSGGGVGTPTVSLSEPSHIITIQLCIVRCDNGGVSFIQNIPINMNNMTNQIDTSLRDAFGTIVSSGLIVTNTLNKLNVSSGVFYYSSLRYAPSAVSNITLQKYYRNNINILYDSSPPLDEVPFSYNNVALGTLVPLNIGEFTKHTLYLVGDGIFQSYVFVYGQSIYLSLILAENAPLPVPPSFCDFGNIIPLAAIVVSSSAIVSIIDIRPTLSFTAPSTTTSADHNSLLNLTVADPHTQYLPADGSRSMTGPLDMNYQSVNNVQTIELQNTAISNSTTLQPSPSLSSNTVLTLPPNTGVNNQLIKTDGSGVLTFTNNLVGVTVNTTAGTTTVPPIQLTNGTLTTVPANGSIEYSGLFYNSFNNTRGIIPTSYYTRTTVNTNIIPGSSPIGTFANIFNPGTITLLANTIYEFEMAFNVGYTATTISNIISFRFNGVGNIKNIMYNVSGPITTISNGVTAASTVVTTSNLSTFLSSSTEPVALPYPQTSSGLTRSYISGTSGSSSRPFVIKGAIETDVSNISLTPQIALSAVVAPTVFIFRNSYCRFTPIMPSGVPSIGPWS